MVARDWHDGAVSPSSTAPGPPSGPTPDRPSDPPAGASGAVSAASYRERLLPPPTWHLLSVFAGLSAAFLVTPFVGGRAATVVGVLVGIGVSVLLVTTSPRVSVEGGTFRAGPAHVPVALLGTPEPLDEPATRAALGPELDARSYVCLRSWCRTAVRVPLTDPADPTPSWIVSTRRPIELADALQAQRP